MEVYESLTHAYNRSILLSLVQKLTNTLACSVCSLATSDRMTSHAVSATADGGYLNNTLGK